MYDKSLPVTIENFTYSFRIASLFQWEVILFIQLLMSGCLSLHKQVELMNMQQERPKLPISPQYGLLLPRPPALNLLPECSIFHHLLKCFLRGDSIPNTICFSEDSEYGFPQRTMLCCITVIVINIKYSPTAQSSVKSNHTKK